MDFGSRQQLAAVTNQQSRLQLGRQRALVVVKDFLKGIHHGRSEQRHALVGRDGLARGFFVPAVGGILCRNNSTGPGGTKKPILLAVLGKEFVVFRRVGKITNVEQDLVKVLTSPGWIQFCHDGGSIDVVAIMIVVIVVIAIAKIFVDTCQGRAVGKGIVAVSTVALPDVNAPTVDEATPALVIDVGCLRIGFQPHRNGLGELIEGGVKFLGRREIHLGCRGDGILQHFGGSIAVIVADVLC
mmetsp:Transcript_34186/g.37788  ORF Transcript_34186/g.37788 Transcript_34186/m.37788 type:complete len:242 (+) Transcript_34186:616-1341(+)